jgi:cyclopropane fatty-acyl-phospholipid synthase-like methyltransferase
MIKKQMERIYREQPLDAIPWHMDHPPDLLRDLVESGRIKPCRAIDMGCGSGSYAIYMAGQGFEMTGVDISEAAVAIAGKRALERGVSCRFVAVDLLGDLSDLGSPFDFAYDWELLHHIFPADRFAYIRNVFELLHPEGLYLSVCFSDDDPGFGGEGKFRKTRLGTVLYFSSEDELRALFQPFFRIEELKIVDIEGKISAHKAVCALMRRKEHAAGFTAAEREIGK